MVLNNTKREAFVGAVIADVPQINYYEVARKLLQTEAIKQLPHELRSILLRPAVKPVQVTAVFSSRLCRLVLRAFVLIILNKCGNWQWQKTQK